MDNEETWTFDEDHIRNHTPSRLSGMSYEEEHDTMVRHVEKISESAALLRMLGSPAYVATMLFRRYFLVETLKGVDVEAVAAACLFVAGKVCEYLRQCKDIIFCTRKVYTKGSEDFPDGEEITEENMKYFGEKKRLLIAERDVLRVLNFDLNVRLPQDNIKIIVSNVFGSSLSGKHVHQAAMNFLVDSVTSDVHILYSSMEIAAACILIGSVYAHVERRTFDKYGARLRALHETFKFDARRVDTAAQALLEMQNARLKSLYFSK